MVRERVVALATLSLETRPGAAIAPGAWIQVPSTWCRYFFNGSGPGEVCWVWFDKLDWTLSKRWSSCGFCWVNVWANVWAKKTWMHGKVHPHCLASAHHACSNRSWNPPTHRTSLFGLHGMHCFRKSVVEIMGMFQKHVATIRPKRTINKHDQSKDIFRICKHVIRTYILPTRRPFWIHLGYPWIMTCTPEIVPRRQFSPERCPALWSSFAASVCVIRVPPSSSGRSCPGQVRQHRPRHHDHLERGVHDVVWPKAVAVVANRPVKQNCNDTLT